MRDTYTAADFNRTLVCNKKRAEVATSNYCKEAEEIIGYVQEHLNHLAGYAKRLHDSDTNDVSTVAETLEDIAIRMVSIESYLERLGRMGIAHRKVSKVLAIYDMFDDLNLND